MKKSTLTLFKLLVDGLKIMPRPEIILDNHVIIIDSKWLDDVSFELQKIILEEEWDGTKPNTKV